MTRDDLMEQINQLYERLDYSPNNRVEAEGLMKRIRELSDQLKRLNGIEGRDETVGTIDCHPHGGKH